MISVFDLFKIGIGPSSSHTTGPMKAAGCFRCSVLKRPKFGAVARIQVTLFGSLAWTGKGHATEKAIALGLSGCLPETIDPNEANKRYADISRMLKKLIVRPNIAVFEPMIRRGTD
jgi:L-serine dehydratase